MSTNPEVPAESPNLWTQQPPVQPQKFFPKKKKRWGLIEVVNSAVILICTQIVFSLIVIFMSITNSVQKGVDPNDIDKIQENALAAATTPILIIVSSVLMYATWLFMMWYSSYHRGLKSFAKDFGVKIKLKDIPLGLLVAALLFGFVQGFSFLLEKLGVDLSGADNTAIFKGHGLFWEIILLIGLVGIVGPIMEELFFRGFLLQGLIRHFRRGNVHEPRSNLGYGIQQNSALLFNGYLAFRNWCYRHKYSLSVVISSLIFGMMHYPYGEGFILGGVMIVFITGFLGFIFAIIAVKTRRIGIPIFAHIFYNSTIAIITLTMM